jgi:CBS domain containing-hemolysin-like protein
MGIYFWLIIFSLLFSAFFSGIEIAFYQANPLRAEVSKSRGVFSGRLVSFFLQHPSAYITNCLTGNNIAVVIYGISFNALFAYLFSLTAVDIFQNAVFVFFFNTIISSILILLLAEFYPKVFFIINPNKSLNILALPFAITYLILFPLNIIVNFISRGLLLATGTRVTKAKPTFDYYDLFNVVLEGDLDTTPDTGLDLDTQIFKNAIELPNIKAREFLIPRPEVQAIEITESIHALKEKFITTGHSKIVVYDGSIDQVVG